MDGQKSFLLSWVPHVQIQAVEDVTKEYQLGKMQSGKVVSINQEIDLQMSKSLHI